MSGKAPRIESNELPSNPFKPFGNDVKGDKDYLRVDTDHDAAMARANGWEPEPEKADIHDQVNVTKGKTRWVSRSKQRSEEVGRREAERARERMANIGATGMRGDAFSSCSSKTMKVFLPKSMVDGG